MKLFDFGRSNRLNVGTPIYDDDLSGRVVGYWTSGRILGRNVSIYVPRFWARKREGMMGSGTFDDYDPPWQIVVALVAIVIAVGLVFRSCAR